MTDRNAIRSRRSFLTISAAGLAAAPHLSGATPIAAAAQRAKTPAGKFPIKSISSANGQRTTKRAYEMILQGADTLDASVAGVTIVEGCNRQPASHQPCFLRDFRI